MGVPLMYRWNGEALQPLPYFKNQALKQFKPGETYRLVEVEDRSMNAHRHFFACINEAWRNLPEDQIEHFPSADILRKWALTFTPFCGVREFQAASRAEAVRVAKYLSDSVDYSRVSISGLTVRQYVPASQAISAMPTNRIFMQSKRAVLDVLAQKLGVTVEELEEAGRRAA